MASAGLLQAAAASAQDSATAGALFEKGVGDMESGRFASACPALEESQRIDPRPGTLFTLAECHANWGKVASAAAQYQEYLDLVSRLPKDQQLRHKARADIARAQLKKLKPTLPTLTLLLPADAPPGTFVTRNGEVLKGAALGLALPVDPGDYVIVTHAPERPEHETKLSIALGESKQVPLEVTRPVSKPPLVAPPVTPPAVPVSPPPAPAGPASSAPPPADATPSPDRGSARKTTAYLVGGVGIAGIAAGTVTGLLVFGKKHTVSANCTAHACNDTGLNAAHSAQTLGLVSNIGFGVGIAGIAVGAVLLLTGSSGATDGEGSRATRWQPLLTAGSDGFATGVLRRW